MVRGLTEAGHTVRVVPTQAALAFVGTATWEALSGRPVHADVFSDVPDVPHVRLGQQADLVLVAPGTADLLARAAHGLADDLLTTTLLTARCPVLVAPAMHTEMWQNPATVRNMESIRGDGHTVVGPGSGVLAGGDQGPGRMAEPEEIVEAVAALFGSGPLSGTTVLVTAGGTREPLDPVRFIGNRSSGKMGNAIAVAAARRGATVTLITTVSAPPGRFEVVEVETAEQMAAEVWKRAPDADVAVLAAAVADFRPADPSGSKMARSAGPPEIALEPTPDILRGVAALDDRPFLVGFAAETGPVEEAIAKGKHQRADLLVANDVGRSDSGFGTDTNQVSIVTPDGAVETWPLATKAEVAELLWDRITAMLGAGS